MGGTFKVMETALLLLSIITGVIRMLRHWCMLQHMRLEKIHMIGLDVTKKIVLTPTLLEYICRLNKETGEFIKKITSFILIFTGNGNISLAV